MSEPTAERPSPEAPAGRRFQLRGLGGLAILAGLAGGGWLLAYWEPRLWPVQVIEVQGELHHHSSELLRKTIGERLSGGFLTADLGDLKSAAAELAWVGGAEIRRVWPDRLEVRVEEHRPVAHWNGRGLVTAKGLVFEPRSGPVPAGLPSLEGPDHRAPEVALRYLKWRDDLMLAGQLIQTVAVDPRGSWHLDLVSGIRLELGSERVEERLARFVASATQLEAAGQPQTVDLRYTNGFAVRWHQAAQAAAQPAAVPVAGLKPVKSAARKTAAAGPGKGNRARVGGGKTPVATTDTGTQTSKTQASKTQASKVQASKVQASKVQTAKPAPAKTPQRKGEAPARGETGNGERGAKRG